jgi:hypothetical protein
VYYRGEDRFKNPFNFDVDIKSGWNAYVVGPYSLRPDGVVYEPIKGNPIVPPLTNCNVPKSLLLDPHHTEGHLTLLTSTGKVPVGYRHKYLCKQAWKLADECIDAEELTAKLRWHANMTCVDPESITLEEINGIVSWMWGKEYYWKRYHEEFSEVKISRSIIDRLIALSGGSDALALYVLLSSKHRNLGNNFAIDFHAMKNAQLTDLGRDRFKRARTLLLKLGFIQRAENYKVGSRPYTYRFP